MRHKSEIKACAVLSPAAILIPPIQPPQPTPCLPAFFILVPFCSLLLFLCSLSLSLSLPLYIFLSANHRTTQTCPRQLQCLTNSLVISQARKATCGSRLPPSRTASPGSGAWATGKPWLRLENRGRLDSNYCSGLAALLSEKRLCQFCLFTLSGTPIVGHERQQLGCSMLQPMGWIFSSKRGSKSHNVH